MNDLIVNNKLICKLFDELHEEEKRLEEFFTGTMKYEQWISKYQWYVKAGFEIALKVLLQEIEQQNGTN